MIQNNGAQTTDVVRELRRREEKVLTICVSTSENIQSGWHPKDFVVLHRLHSILDRIPVSHTGTAHHSSPSIDLMAFPNPLHDDNNFPLSTSIARTPLLYDARSIAFISDGLTA